MRPLILPWPPSVNGYWQNRVVIPRGSRSGFVQTFLTERAKKYRVDVQAAVWERFGLVRPTRARLLVVIAAFPPDRRDRDLDNTFKAALDALTHAGVWVDDEQIDRIEIERCGVAKPGRLEVTILPWKRRDVAEQQLIPFEAAGGDR